MMRSLFAVLIAVPCLAQPARAEAPQQPTAAPPAAHVPAAHTHMTWQQRFAAANTTHDGHLTLEQAKTGYTAIARHFAAIDTTGKGYVTEDDIAAWHKQQRSLHQPVGENKLRPRHAFQPGVNRHPAVKASTSGTVTVGPDDAGRSSARPPPG